MTSYIGMVRIFASFGSVAVAACTIVIRIIMFLVLPAWGLSNAAATLVGQNLGAGRPDRAETSVWRATAYNVAFLSVTGLLCFIFTGTIVGWFTTDPQVGPIATRGLRVIAAGFPFYAAGYVLTQSFNGAGDTVTPTLINLGCFWAFELPLAYALGLPLGFGPKRRVLGDGHRVFDDVGGERAAVPARTLEIEEGLGSPKGLRYERAQRARGAYNPRHEVPSNRARHSRLRSFLSHHFRCLGPDARPEGHGRVAE
jgi:hypothetical protein